MYLPTNLTVNFLDFDAGCPLWTPETSKSIPRRRRDDGGSFEVKEAAGGKSSEKDLATSLRLGLPS